MDEPRILSYSWRSKGSVVTFRLEPVVEGTRLRLAPDRLNTERIAEPDEMIHRGRRQAHAEMEV